MALPPCVLAFSSTESFVLATAASPQGLTTAGWIFMILSLGSVLTFVVWCYSRLLRTTPESIGAAQRDGESLD